MSRKPSEMEELNPQVMETCSNCRFHSNEFHGICDYYAKKDIPRPAWKHTSRPNKKHEQQIGYILRDCRCRTWEADKRLGLIALQ
jgi:hypothetical protein